MNSPSGLVFRAFRKAYEVLGISRDRIYQNKPFEGVVVAKEANRLISKAIEDGHPYMVSRFGTPESLTILNSLDIQISRHPSSLVRYHAAIQGRWTAWQDKVKRLIQDNVGFFPTTDSALEQFAAFYTSQIPSLDMLGVWGFVPGESHLIRHYCPHAVLFDPRALEPYFFENPWSASLQGRKVLVIHPFTDSITAQYKNRIRLFKNPGVLPEFELLTLRAVQSLAGIETPFADWFSALDWMKAEMGRINFDVAIIGAGAYGLPLCAHAKSLGKVAVHMGGATQILFGVRGKRWDNMEEFSALINEHWIRPSPGEGITNASKIEDGCYW